MNLDCPCHFVFSVNISWILKCVCSCNNWTCPQNYGIKNNNQPGSCLDARVRITSQAKKVFFLYGQYVFFLKTKQWSDINILLLSVSIYTFFSKWIMIFVLMFFLLKSVNLPLVIQLYTFCKIYCFLRKKSNENSFIWKLWTYHHK